MNPARYKNYLLAVLMVIAVCSNVDRLILGMVLQDIKIEFSLTDTQLGFLGGFAFAAFYAVMGVPIARWADRGNRVTILSLATALWSAATALCGAAGGFLHLLLIRIGVGVGEAGCVPTSHSLIADYFSRAERPRAAAIYSLALPVALMFGYFVAGWLNQIYGWRTTFVVLGVPGLAIAALAALTLKEPRRNKLPGAASPAPAKQTDMKEALVTLWGNTTFRHMLICFSVWQFFGYGLTQWQATFFIRSHGLQSGEIGNWFAIIYGVGGVLGTWLGGEWATRYAGGNERLQLRACAGMFSFLALLLVGAYLAPDPHVALGAMFFGNLGAFLSLGPMFATIQTLVPSRMRALAMAILYFFANLIGAGLGPLAAGMLSDALQPLAGQHSLRYALALLSPGFFWAAWHLWRAARTVTRDIEATQAAEGIRAPAAARLAEPLASKAAIPVQS